MEEAGLDEKYAESESTGSPCSKGSNLLKLPREIQVAFSDEAIYRDPNNISVSKPKLSSFR